MRVTTSTINMCGIKKTLEEIAGYLRDIRDELKTTRGPGARSATLIIQGGSMGTTGTPPVPYQLTVGATADAVWQEWSGLNGTGTQLPEAAAPTFSSDTPSVATVDPNSGVVTGVAVGNANITGVDAANGLTASAPVTVVAPVAQSATLTIVAPAQNAATPAVKKAA